MDKNGYYLTDDNYQALFDALLNSICLDDIVAQGQVDPKKILRKRDHDGDDKDEDPSARPNQGNAPTKGSNSDKSVHAEESVVEPTQEVIMDASNDNVVNDVDQPQNESAPKHNWFTQPLRPPTPNPAWNKEKADDDSQEHTWFNNLLSAEKGPLTFDELMATLIDFL
ncbi:hypothetical protein Tco_0604700 [Tanacetum coccineum]